ncbi:hypothetical protein OK348_12175 [Flavobacterium sp. MXW15]|uniref:Uncharacterized protein n=1 Tax=Xanthomonas chitinilytica TaxID=2989819 RepID=A0ABT3JY40_9XANT|nr:hypothetical protein [Xanthomonas sp. H13-6]MCW4455543.1 hypothetical protein [Flavobacterium sp. MXW15]MCW4473376.1 hypothetical protein [Xanthomonas sp. H13-6]
MEKLKNLFYTGSAFAATAMLSAPAFAGELADAVTDGVDRAELMLIGVAVLTVAGLIFMIRSGKKAAN